MELAIGNEYIMTNDDGGLMAVVVIGFERDGRPTEDPSAPVAILRPSDPTLAAWFNKDYDLGRAHWAARLTPVTPQ